MHRAHPDIYVFFIVPSAHHQLREAGIVSLDLILECLGAGATVPANGGGQGRPMTWPTSKGQRDSVSAIHNGVSSEHESV